MKIKTWMLVTATLLAFAGGAVAAAYSGIPKIGRLKPATTG